MSEHQLQTSEWIGIDLGITHTAAAIYVAHQSGPGYVEMLYAVESNDTLTESCVYFDQKSDVVLVGRMAAKEKARNPANTICESKRFIGLPFSDNLVNEFRGKFKEYNMVDSAGHAAFEIRHNGRTIHQTPIDIAAKLLEKIRKTADEWSKGKRKYTKAIITVPLYFSQQQFDCTIRAAKLAGFSEVHLIGEPNAAAIFYGLNTSWLEGFKILVMDFGNSTLDVSILQVYSGELKVLGRIGKKWFGGWDLDEQIRKQVAKWIDGFCKECKEYKNHSKCRPDNCCQRMQALLVRREYLKTNLSTPRNLSGQFHLRCMKYRNIVKIGLNKVIKTINEALDTTGLSPSEIQELQMTGDPSWTPALSDMLEEIGFTCDKIKSREPRHAVAKGAAIVGANLDEQMKAKLPTMNLADEIYHSPISSEDQLISSTNSTSTRISPSPNEQMQRQLYMRHIPVEAYPDLANFRMSDRDQDTIVEYFRHARPRNLQNQVEIQQAFHNLAAVGVRPHVLAQHYREQPIDLIRNILERPTSPDRILALTESGERHINRQMLTMAWNYLRSEAYPDLPPLSDFELGQGGSSATGSSSEKDPAASAGGSGSTSQEGVGGPSETRGQPVGGSGSYTSQTAIGSSAASQETMTNSVDHQIPSTSSASFQIQSTSSASTETNAQKISDVDYSFPKLPCAIDFGTYSSFAAIFCEKEPQLIKLDSDSYELPSIVSFDIADAGKAFTFSNLLIGNEAKNGFTNSNNITIFYPKILLENPDKNYELFPALFFQKNANGQITIAISNENQERPEQIAAERLLSHIYLRLEKMSPLIFARRKLPLDIVIPIPFAFSSLHKPILNELMDRILKINEGPKPKSNCIFIEFSHCSAIAYARTKIDDGVALVNGFKILSVHVGGGFFDIALIKIDMHGYSMEEVDGSFFGKVDCDKTLLKEIIKQYNNIPENEYQKLLARCETASVKILEQKFATISNDGISGLPSIAPKNCNFVCPWYRFVQNQNENMLSMLNNKLDDGIKKMAEIEETTIPVLSGCIAAKPHFQNYLSKALSINVNKFVHIKKEEIAKAASLHAFLRKLPISVGFSESTGKYKRIFKRGSDVGFNISVSFQISELPLDAGKMKLIQGERELASENSIFCEITIPEKIEIDQHYYKIQTIKFILNNFGRFSMLAFDKSNKIFAAEIFHVDYLEKIMPINYIGEHLVQCSGETMSDLMKLQNMKIEIFSKHSNNINLLKMVEKASDYIKNLDPDMQVENQNHLEMITSIKINEEKVRKLKNFISHLKSLPTQMPNQMGASTSAKEKIPAPDGWIEKSERIDEDLFFPNKYSIFALFDSIQNLYKCNNMRILSGSNGKQFVWYCVLVDQRKLLDFDAKIGDDTLNVAEFGRILYSDWGKYPSQKIREEIRKKFLPEIDDKFREHFLEQIDKKLEIEIEIGLSKEYSENKFFMAVFRGDFQTVKNMFKEDNTRIVAEFKYNKLILQPLHLAIWKNHLDIVNFLLDNGANIADMALIKLGNLHLEICALHLAIWKYQEMWTSEHRFLWKMIDLTQWKSSQRTKKFEQIFLSRMRNLIGIGPAHFSKSHEEEKSDFIQAIQLAAIRNKIELVFLLIDNGNAPELEKAHRLCYVKAKSSYNIFFKSPSWHVILVDENNFDLITSLRSEGSGSNYNLENLITLLRSEGSNYIDFSKKGKILFSGWGTTIPKSIEEILFVQFYRNFGNMYKAFEGCYGQTPMHFFAEYGRSDWFRLPDIDVTLRRKTDNFTPLHVAIAERINVKDFTLLYLLRILIMKYKTKKEEELKELLSELIHFAARMGNVFAIEQIKMEIKCVYNDRTFFYYLINHPDKNGFIPLHIAVLHNNEDMVTMLLKQGSSDFTKKVKFIHAGNEHWFTAKELAAFCGHKQMEEIFEKYSNITKEFRLVTI